jgi:hypothetical protein
MHMLQEQVCTASLTSPAAFRRSGRSQRLATKRPALPGANVTGRGAIARWVRQKKE